MKEYLTQDAKNKPIVKKDNESNPIKIMVNIFLTTTFLIVTAIALPTSFAFRYIGSFFSIGDSEPQIKKTSLLIKQINNISELATTAFVMDAVVEAYADRQIGDFILAKTKLLYIVRGEVKAGIDLSKITPEDINIDGQTIEIKLPPPEIIDSIIDPNESEVYDYDRGWFNLGPDVGHQLQTKAQRDALKKIKKTACERDILLEANKKAVSLPTGLMINFDYENVKIIPTNGTNCG